MEAGLTPNSYAYFDLAGSTVFNAGGDGSVPKCGPIFELLGKQAFAFYDKPKTPLSAEATEQLSGYLAAWESPESGIEKVLVNETPISTLRRFLKDVKDRADYPSKLPKIVAGMAEDHVRQLAEKVLIARKGDAGGYGALLLEQCSSAAEIPATIRMVLEAIHAALLPTVPASASQTPGPASEAGTAAMATGE